MNSLESMRFSMWLDKQDWYINTFEKTERIRIIESWLEAHRVEVSKINAK
jgi:hypothetical protein